MPSRYVVLAVMVMALGLSMSVRAQTKAPKVADALAAHIQVRPDAISWQPVPQNWADGPPPAGFTLGKSEVAIIQGDPTKEGAPFVIRIRSTPGTQLPPHWHDTDENITVLSGVFCVGMGERFDQHACQDMPAGSYIVMPKGMRHFAVAKGDVVQVHGIGPFKIHWVK
jgi:quercetin dioxygenase-like cupin family protein